MKWKWPKVISQQEFWTARDVLESPAGRVEYPAKVHMPYDIGIMEEGALVLTQAQLQEYVVTRGVTQYDS